MATNDQARKEALNQALLREVNDRIEKLAADAAYPEFLCECADPACIQTLPLSIAEYESVRSSPVRFALKAGHENPAVERVVEDHEGYIVVEKVGEAAKVAGELHRRSL